MRYWLGAVLAMTIGCGDDEAIPQADAATADGAGLADAPVSADANSACLSLAPNTWQGDVPFGTVDLSVSSFGAGDCLTITGAELVLTGPSDETMTLSFPYPVNGPIGSRTVTTNFTQSATMMYQPIGGPDILNTVTIDVSVTTWVENASGTHDVDIVVDITEPGWDLDPLAVTGTFCRWDALLCSAEPATVRTPPARRSASR